MKTVMLLLTFSMAICASATGQESGRKPDANPNSDLNSAAAILQKFVGSWKTESEAVGTDSIAPAAYTGTMKASMLGKTWLVNQYNATIEGAAFDAIQRLRYDAASQTYVGTWVDSYMTTEWKLVGKVDGNRLVVNSEGPDPSDPKRITQFRDIYEFKSANLIASTSEMKSADGKWSAFMTGVFRKEGQPDSPGRPNVAVEGKRRTQVLPFLMFVGKAEEAMNFYTGLFEDSEISKVVKYRPGETGKEGTIKTARFSVAGQQVLCIDSPPVHAFTFTPSFSFFVECETEAQLDDLFSKLSKDGKVMMPAGDYGFSRKFGWTSDRFGVSWQLNLGNE